jgi:hypothetical protein
MLESRDTVVGGDGVIDAGALKSYLNTLLAEHADNIDAECEGWSRIWLRFSLIQTHRNAYFTTHSNC